MTWVRIDDRANTHPKTLSGDLSMFGLWVAGLCYCNLHNTNGRIPKSALRAIFPSDHVSVRVMLRCATGLVRASRWLDQGSHWAVYGYEEEQGAALSGAVEARKAAARRKKRGQRSKKPSNDIDEVGHLSPGDNKVTGKPCPQETPEPCPPGTPESSDHAVPTPRPGPARPLYNNVPVVPSDPVVAKLKEEIESHKVFSHLDTLGTAEQIAGFRQNNARPLNWHIEAIRRTAVKVAGHELSGRPWAPGAIGSYLLQACANPSKPDEREGPVETVKTAPVAELIKKSKART